MRTTPKFSPFSARTTTDFTTWSITWPRLIFLCSTSSEMRQTLGLVWKAHSRAMCEAERPISLMKCQYLRLEAASRQMLPMSSE